MRPKKKSMSESAEAYYLRLNNHQSFMTGALSELYHNAVLVDCTLTAQGRQLRAHQTVLAACSPYFKDIFTQYNTSQYPVVIIKDMPFTDLKAIVEYVYCGEVTIPRRQLQSVLNSGAQLQVKGLFEFNKNKLSDIIESDVEGRAETNSECETVGHNEPNDKQNRTKYLKNNCLNACDSYGNRNKKGTRKSRKSTDKCFNGCDRESEICDKTLPDLKIIDNDISDNDQVTNNSDNINREYSIKLIDGNERAAKMSEKLSETSLEPPIISSNVDEHAKEKSMTGKPVLNTASGGADDIVPLMPFGPLQPSVMIDVKPNVNQASHPSKFCFDFITNTGTHNSATTTTGAVCGTVCSDINSIPDTKTVENSEQQNQSQNELKDEINDINIYANKSISGNQFNDIPSPHFLKQINEKAFDVNNKNKQNQTPSTIRKRSLISATNDEQKHQIVKKKTSKECKAATKSKGNSDRTDKKFECPVCQKAYVSQQNMKEHMRNTHKYPEKKYVCSVCQKEYGWKHALDRHFKSKHTAD